MNKILLVLVIVMLSSPSYGQYIISTAGTVSSGESISIDGTGFGSKISGPPAMWDTFDGGLPGSTVRDPIVGPDWTINTVGSVNIPPVYSNLYSRSGALSAKCTFPVEQWACQFASTTPGVIHPEIYFSAYMRCDYFYPYTINHKLFRVHHTYFNTNIGYPNIYVGIMAGINASLISQDAVLPLYTREYFPYSFASYLTNWVRLEGYFYASTGQAADGTMRFSIDNVVLVNETSAINQIDAASSGWETVAFGDFLGHSESPGTSDSYWDDVYVDYTQARVEIGNSIVFNECTHREIQIPSAWADNSITVTFNQGSFNVGDSVYLFVVDSTGSASSGFQLTIGTPNTSWLITPPSNLRIDTR
jgi:hypothetical protein